MATYQYSVSYRDSRGRFTRVGVSTERKAFAIALDCDREGGELLSVNRETWEVNDDTAKLIAVEPYRFGKPVANEAG